MSCSGEERMLWVKVQHHVKMAMIAVSSAALIKKSSSKLLQIGSTHYHFKTVLYPDHSPYMGHKLPLPESLCGIAFKKWEESYESS
jgi:hypothetical protein